MMKKKTDLKISQHALSHLQGIHRLSMPRLGYDISEPEGVSARDETFPGAERMWRTRLVFHSVCGENYFVYVPIAVH